MAKVNPLPVEPLQPQLEPQYPGQPRYDEQQPPALAQPQEPPRAPSDGNVQLWLDPQLQPPQQPVIEQPYLQLRPPRLPMKPAEHVLAPDSDHSWTVAGAAAWNIFCCSLLRRGLPVMFHAVGETFATTAKGSVAWTNAFIYSLAYTLSPVTMMLCSMMPLRLLSVVGALLIGVGQIVCYGLGSLSLVVPAIAVSCGLGAALSSVVDEMTLHLHFLAQRPQAALLYHAAFSLSAIVYPLVLSLLLELYGLNGALLVSGAISLNALVGSMFMTRPVWMSPSDPLPPIHRPDGTQTTAAAAIQPVTQAPEMTMKEDVKDKPEAPTLGIGGDEYPTAEKVAAPSGVESGNPTGAPASGPPSGASSVGPERRVSAGGDGTPKPVVTTTGGAPPNPPEPKPSNSAAPPTTGKVEPQQTTGKAKSQPTSRNVASRPTTGKLEPQPTTGKVKLQPTTGKVKPQLTTVKVESQPTSGKVESQPTNDKEESQPTNDKVKPQLTTGKVKPQLTTGKVKTQLTTGKVASQPTTGKVASQPTTGKVELQPSSGKVESQPTNDKEESQPTSGKVKPQLTTGKVKPQLTTGKVKTQLTTGKVEPQPTSGKVEPQPTSGKVESQPTNDKEESQPTSVKAESQPTNGKAESQPTNGKAEPQPTNGKVEPQPGGEQPAAASEAGGSVVAGVQQVQQEPAMEVVKVLPTTGASVRPMPELSVGVILALHCALTSLSVTAGVVVYDYVMDEDPDRSSYATFTVVSYGAGDLVGRLSYQALLSTGEHRKVMAVQAFLQGGVLFLMAMSKEVVLLAPASFGLGWMSSTLEMLSVPVLQRFLAPDAVEQQLSICRASSGIACLIGPLLVTLFRDDGPQSYAVMFIISGGLSLLAGALWLPGVKQEMDEAYGKAGDGKAAATAAYPVLAEPGQATAEPGATGATKPEEAKPGADEQGPAGVDLPPAAAEDTAAAAKTAEAKPGPTDAVPTPEAQEQPRPSV